VLHRRKNAILWTVVSAIPVAYALLFSLAYAWVGGAIGVVSTSSILLAAWLLGMRAALLAALLAASANTLLYVSVGIELGAAFRSSFMAAAFFLGVGLIIARIASDKRHIERLTVLDRLTGLPNRDAFETKVQTLVAAGTVAHVALVDVFGFRDVNESFGHSVGNDVIREIARRLAASFKDDMVARVGSDDFAVLAELPQTDEAFAARALDAFRAPFLIGGSLLNVEGRVGIARSPDHGDSSSTLLGAAESASRQARRMTARWALASAMRSRDSAERLQMLGDLRQSLDRNELRLHYQPILDLTSGEVLGFEALMRWQRNGELVAPAQFIPLAEQAGLIVPLTDWVVGEAMRQIAEWGSVGHPQRISINVGAKAIGGSSHLETVIMRAAAEHGVSASQLTVEVTETDVMTDPALASRTLAGIKKLGVSIAMDDFGTGYSSLGYLNQLPLDEVKIDRSFISRLLRDPQTSAIVRAAVDLSHALGLDAVAEGVEDAATMERLVVLGCDRVQGYFIARPMPADAVLPWLQRHVPNRAPAIASIADAPLHVATTQNANSSTVLVVDDEHSLRVATHRMLSSQGYNVLHAATASEALRICTEQRDAIDLVVTDIFLTDWRGHELAGRIREMQPRTKFLFVSGDPMAGAMVKGAPFLAKPFSKQQLIDRVGLVLA
jgi:diguanylate cyclase (GGDEF)-like protein